LQAFAFSDGLRWNDADPNSRMPGYVIEWDKSSRAAKPWEAA